MLASSSPARGGSCSACSASRPRSCPRTSTRRGATARRRRRTPSGWRARRPRRVRRDGAAVVGADTIVVIGGEILGKPRDAAEARAMLRRLAGRGHDVFTAVAVAWRGTVVSGTQRTAVLVPAAGRRDDRGLRRHGRAARQGRRVRHPGLRRRPRRAHRGRLLHRHGAGAGAPGRAARTCRPRVPLRLGDAAGERDQGAAPAPGRRGRVALERRSHLCRAPPPSGSDPSGPGGAPSRRDSPRPDRRRRPPAARRSAGTAPPAWGCCSRRARRRGRSSRRPCAAVRCRARRARRTRRSARAACGVRGPARRWCTPGAAARIRSAANRSMAEVPPSRTQRAPISFSSVRATAA